MVETAHAPLYERHDGTIVRAARYDGRVTGFAALLAAFPGRIAPHPHRDDAVLVTMASGRCVRIGVGDWVVALPGGSLETQPDDQFHMGHHITEASAA